MNDAQQAEQDVCPTCKGTGGHHYMTCSDQNALKPTEPMPARTLEQIQGEEYPDYPGNEELLGLGEQAELPADHYDERNPAEGNNEIPPGTRSDRLPPTADDLASNQLLWLVARTCHEANRAYCREVMADHSHKPWDETAPELRASIYDGVVKHFEDSELQPEESHQAWMKYKLAEGWVFGNLKDADAKTHPCLMPWHQLHNHDRAKDHLFAAICKAMFGE